MQKFIKHYFCQPCLLCQQTMMHHNEKAHYLCNDCYQSLPWIIKPCYCCSTPSRPLIQQRCLSCWLSPPNYHRIITCWHYQSPIREIILSLKFKANFSLLGFLSEQLVQIVQKREITLPDIIVPVPLHIARLRERGFNQAQLLAKKVAKKLKVTMKPICQRVINTEKQTKCNQTMRVQNIQDAFVCQQQLHKQTILIVDDIVTTESTIRAMADCLLTAGALQVNVLCCAKTITTKPPAN